MGFWTWLFGKNVEPDTNRYCKCGGKMFLCETNDMDSYWKCLCCGETEIIVKKGDEQ